jgi:uncharacterized protein (TIGR02453 family)
MAGFEGFPVAALDFYDDLEVDNTKSFWEAHKATYDEAVRAPMAALMAALEPEFGDAKIFRPYRDVRFAKDKTPYKTHQGGFVQAGPATGWYVQVSAAGVRVSVGYYHAEKEPLAAIRRGIDDDLIGPALLRIVRRLEKAGWERGGETLKTTPRGYDADHPRIDLLRHKSLTFTKDYGFDELVHTPELEQQVRADWRAGRPLVEWVLDRVG